MKTKAYFIILSSLLLLLVSSSTIFAQNNENDSTAIMDFVDDAPEFPGGESMLNKFISKNIIYPQIAIDNNYQGTVYVQFIILTDGSVDYSSVKILRGQYEILNKEAIRVVKLMPKWKPGTQNGKPVRVLFNLPIKFRLV